MATVTNWAPYVDGQAGGVGLLVAAGFLSLSSVLTLLIIMGISAYRTKGSPDDHVFVRTHVAAYFVSLLLCDLTQGIGSIINIAWIKDGGVTNNGLCVAQAAIKQTGNVGTALWSFVIAVHTFFLLFYRAKVPDWVCYVVLVVVWLILGAVLSLGPGVFATKEKGPFYGISGLWCWMTSGYPVERYTLEYCFMFASAGFSFVLYFLVFLRLRGNIVTNGYRFSFQRRVVVKGYSSRQYNAVTDPSQNTHVMKVARQMMWYPVAYATLVVPIAAARFASFGGAPVPWQVTIATATIFMLSGFVNAILFTTTRRVLPASNIFPKFIRERFGISTGTGMNTHQRSFTNTNISMRGSKPYHSTGGIGVSVNIEKAVDYDLESPEMKGAYPMTERPFRPFDPVAPFSHQSLGSPTASGRKVIWNDQNAPQPGRGRASSLGSSSSDISGMKAGDGSLPHATHYPSPPNQQSDQNPFPPSPSPSLAAYLNPRDRGDRGMSAAYGYGGHDFPTHHDGYDMNYGRGV